MNRSKWALALGAVMMVSTATADADAFCGFYVAGADAELYNDATMVVMMRDGERTVLSMQNGYQGPAEDFAMVVPVPVVLQKENVKTLPNAVFGHVDRLAAPRLVEYWEQDPCAPIPPGLALRSSRTMAKGAAVEEDAEGGGVKVEAQFEVGEYEIVILSADDSSALDQWIKDNGYNIPDGAEPLLRPYVQDGSKFFVAKVNVEKVTFEEKDGQKRAKLSPLRFHYDTEDFRLPVRLGLVNSQGKQDLLVHILAKQRYQVANYENVTIPTNIDVDATTKKQFGAFYASLFDQTLAKNPKSVVTEYAWAASSCDPCPSPTLDEGEIATLGGDVIEGVTPWSLVLTRLHARYDKASLGEDLIFETADPIAGGRERIQKGDELEVGSVPFPRNMFQGRYAVRHAWEGPIECANPVRGRWGGPPGGEGGPGSKPPVEPALDTAFAKRGEVKLASAVQHDVPEIGVKAAKAVVPHAGAVPAAPSASPSAAPAASAASAPVAPPKYQPPPRAGCTCEVPGDAGTAGAWAWLAGLAFAFTRRRR